LVIPGNIPVHSWAGQTEGFSKVFNRGIGLVPYFIFKWPQKKVGIAGWNWQLLAFGLGKGPKFPANPGNRGRLIF